MLQFFSKRSRARRVAAIFCVAALLFGCGAGAKRAEKSRTTLLQHLGAGWNLGNTLDSHIKGFYSEVPEDYEMLWLNPPASQELFQTVRDAGFKTVRIPVTWYLHMDTAHQVDASWMQRVRQVVDSALDTGLHVILNAHHEDWYSPYPHNIAYAEERLTALWRQIAAQFADYGEQLLFEGMNEPRLVGDETEWQCGTPEARKGINRLNQAFVDTVRAAGGQNRGRLLLVPTYCAVLNEEALADFVVPRDDRVAVSLHFYQPFSFTHPEDTAAEWSASNQAHIQDIDAALETIHRHFTAKGIAVAFTEFGAVDKGNTPSRLAWTEYLAAKAAERGIPCIWWDNGAGEEPGPLNTFALVERDSLEWHYPEIARAVVEAYPN